MKGKRKKEDEEMQAPNLVKKERKKRWSKVAAESDSESLHVVLFTEMPLSYELWKLKIIKMCF